LPACESGPKSRAFANARLLLLPPPPLRSNPRRRNCKHLSVRTSKQEYAALSPERSASFYQVRGNTYRMATSRCSAYGKKFTGLDIMPLFAGYRQVGRETFCRQRKRDLREQNPALSRPVGKREFAGPRRGGRL